MFILHLILQVSMILSQHTSMEAQPRNITSTSTGGACVNGISVRKEYRDMGKEEWDRFSAALKTLQATKSKDKQPYSEWDRITKLHITHGHHYHNSRLFMHWHRAFTAAFETALREIDPLVSVPYWDYTYDWQDAEHSPIMTDEFGLDVKINGTQGDCRYFRHFQNPHCITRGYTPGKFPQLPSDEFVNLLVSQVDDQGRFSELLEKSVHNPIHVALGGDMNKLEAPNDPIFWLIHAFVDQVWTRWQSSHASGLNSTEAATVLQPFGITALQAENNLSLCYTYQPFSKARTFKPRLMVISP